MRNKALYVVFIHNLENNNILNQTISFPYLIISTPYLSLIFNNFSFKEANFKSFS
jgi:hypothetical protein